MKYLSPTSLLLTTLLVIPTHSKSMDPENQRQPTEERRCDCSDGFYFTGPAVIGGVIAVPLCAALKVSVGIAFAAALASGVTGTLIHKCCCPEPDNA